MRFRLFRIANYRAIRSAEVPVSNNLIPLIGVNESGKTSILHAILAFDRNGDSIGGGVHLNYRNRYLTENHACSISADVVIDHDDFAVIAGSLRIPEESELFRELKMCAEQAVPITLERRLDLEGRPYSLHGLSHSAETTNLVQAIFKRLPYILYFDDFTDRVPDKVEFQRVDNDRGYRYSTGAIAPWQRVIEEIINRATDGGYSLSTFVNIEDQADRRGVLADITDELEREVIDAWKELKSWSHVLADDASDLELKLEYEPSVDTRRFAFEFVVSDRSTNRSRYFSVQERSKGFQWFFNFQMRLRFNPKYRETTSGAIYLLDEPGSYLHASAQEELLKSLKQISENNTILYCTHSQHLLNPEEVNIGQARIVAKEEGVVRVIPFGDAPIEKYQGALTPLHEALRLRVGMFGQPVKVALITEGITEYYLINLLAKHHPDWSLGPVRIIPGAGVDQLAPLISFAIAFTERFAVLMDSDRPGKAAKQRYSAFFNGAIDDQLLLLHSGESDDNVVLEDLLSDADKQRLIDATGSRDAKAAVVRLHFASEEDQQAFVAALDAETLGNLNWLHSIILNLQGDRHEDTELPAA